MNLNEQEAVTWGDVAKVLSTIKKQKSKQDATQALKGFGKLGASLIPGLDFISNAIGVLDNINDAKDAATALMNISKNVTNLGLKAPDDSKLKQMTGPFWDALRISPELSSMLDDKVEVEFINNFIIPKISRPESENEPLPNMDVELGKWLNQRGLKDKSDVHFKGRSGEISETLNEELNRIKSIINY